MNFNVHFDVQTACDYASSGRLETWIHTYLTTGTWANPALSDGLHLQERFWVGPLEVALGRLTQVCGPDPTMEFPVDRVGYERRVNRLAATLVDPRQLPPLIVQYRQKDCLGDCQGILSIRDGNHRYAALIRRGFTTCWVLIWFDSEPERAAWIGSQA